jgi:hypothetical protein
MIRAIVLFALSSVLVSSCVISKHSNMGFVRNAHLDSEAEVFSVSATTFIARPIIKKALMEDGDADSEAVAKLVSQLRGVRVLVVENQKDFIKINKRLDNYLKRKKYEEWMSINSDGDRVNINAKIKSNKIKRLLLTVNSEDGDGVFVRLKGKFSINDILESIGTLTDSGLKMKKKSQKEPQKI